MFDQGSNIFEEVELYAHSILQTHIKQQPTAQDQCRNCGGKLELQHMQYICTKCHVIYEPNNNYDVLPMSRSDDPVTGAPWGRFRLVGRDAHLYQSDLDRINSGSAAELQKRNIYRELVMFNNIYMSRKGRPLPKNLFSGVADTYHVMITHSKVHRSNMKYKILAKILSHQAAAEGIIYKETNIADFMQLEKRGFARGDGYVRAVCEDNNLNIDMNYNTLEAHIQTSFNNMEIMLEGRLYVRQKRFIVSLVERSIQKHIGIGSVLRSKVIAATYEVLNKTVNHPPSLDIVAKKCQIRKHTIKRFLLEIAAHKSHFLDIYFNLESES